MNRKMLQLDRQMSRYAKIFIECRKFDDYYFKHKKVPVGVKKSKKNVAKRVESKKSTSTVVREAVNEANVQENSRVSSVSEEGILRLILEFDESTQEGKSRYMRKDRTRIKSFSPVKNPLVMYERSFNVDTLVI